ncbi:hypothetical protein FNV43_RR12937 [Rhamnella rubrinervis]|uniref:Uncharacterized protein n=1 Tax=Rhamnella rubrinervis TaxID=2594499 RepID=A0A8K0MED4_9ROSA|nr:hypothetical protein FNV43_RR12937 [Rhamnella rubrinervis]
MYLLMHQCPPVRQGRDAQVVKPVAVRAVTVSRESSFGSYTGRRSHRSSVLSTSSGGYRDVGLDDDLARRELEGRRAPPIVVAIFEEDQEDSIGSDDYVPHGYTLESVNPEAGGSAYRRRSHRSSVPSISGGGYRGVGLDDDLARRELEDGGRMVFLRGEAVMILIWRGGYYYMPIGRFQQMQAEHFHEMFLWYLD